MISLGLCLARLALHGLVVDLFLGVEAVAHDVEPLAAHVQRHAVGEVAAFGQAHAHDGVARLEEGQEHGLVGLRAGVRLHVGGVGAEQLLGAVDRQLLDDVDVFAAAVVALAGVALGVLVGQLRALGRHDGGRGVVLAGDQLDVLFLAAVLGLDGGPELGVGLFDEDVAVVHAAVLTDIGPCDARGLPRRTADRGGRCAVMAHRTWCKVSSRGTLPGGGPRQRRAALCGRRAYRQSRAGESVAECRLRSPTARPSSRPPPSCPAWRPPRVPGCAAARPAPG